jgi:purine-nucleoside phosphorylase
MSTVPEAMIANALGMKVIGLSCISNLAAGISGQPLSHQDVKEASIQALPNMKKIVLEFTSKIEGNIL